MRLPKDPENWIGAHADKAIEIARKKFARYEMKIDFTNRNASDQLYREYQIAREVAVNVARMTNWRYREAEMLP